MIHIRYLLLHIFLLFFFFSNSKFVSTINVLYSLFLFSIFFVECQDLPALYLQGGSIIPLGPPHQHVGESNPLDDLTLLVALDECGKFKDFNIFRNVLKSFTF